MLRSRIRLSGICRTLTAIATAALLMTAAGPAAAKIDWHDSYESALKAAKTSRKPIFVFVYLSDDGRNFSGPREQISVNRPGRAQGQRSLDVERMLQQTFADPNVIAAAKDFEPVKLDLLEPANDAARHDLRVSPGIDPTTEARAASYPITLFLDSIGEELFRRHGSMPAMGYAAQLKQAATLHACREAVLAEPRDPVRRRNLGRAYMEMDPTPEDRFYNAAVEHLEAAVRLDPDNAAGANFDAQVDLAILSIPRAPEQSVARLFQLQTEDADGHRKLEVQYYMAVAHFVMEDFDAARKLLSEFETDNKKSPYYDSGWTSQALGLLQYLKQVTR